MSQSVRIEAYDRRGCQKILLRIQQFRYQRRFASLLKPNENDVASLRAASEEIGADSSDQQKQPNQGLKINYLFYS